MEKEKFEYLSYNCLSRKPLYYGVPFLLGLLFFVFIVFSSLLAVAMSSKVIGVIPVFLAGGLFGIKLICENDSLAFEKLKWSVKGIILRVKTRSFNIEISPKIISDKKRMERINDFFK